MIWSLEKSSGECDKVKNYRVSMSNKWSPVRLDWHTFPKKEPGPRDWTLWKGEPVSNKLNSNYSYTIAHLGCNLLIVSSVSMFACCHVRPPGFFFSFKISLQKQLWGLSPSVPFWVGAVASWLIRTHQILNYQNEKQQQKVIINWRIYQPNLPLMPFLLFWKFFQGIISPLINQGQIFRESSSHM